MSYLRLRCKPCYFDKFFSFMFTSATFGAFWFDNFDYLPFEGSTRTITCTVHYRFFWNYVSNICQKDFPSKRFFHSEGCLLIFTLILTEKFCFSKIHTAYTVKHNPFCFSQMRRLHGYTYSIPYPRRTAGRRSARPRD